MTGISEEGSKIFKRNNSNPTYLTSGVYGASLVIGLIGREILNLKPKGMI